MIKKMFNFQLSRRLNPWFCSLMKYFRSKVCSEIFLWNNLRQSFTEFSISDERRGGSKGGEADPRSSPVVGASEPGPGETAHSAHAPALSEFHVSVSAVLENTSGLDHLAKSRVMSVVSRLVDKLHRTEAERDTATLQLKGELIVRPQCT